MHKNEEKFRVVSRYLMAKSLGLGETIDNGDIRILRRKELFLVWDLTNAGKRGKKVRVLHIRHRDQEQMDATAKSLLKYRSFDQVENYAKELQAEFPRKIEVSEETERGIDVNPSGTEVVQLEYKVGDDTVRITADPQGWSYRYSAWFANKEKEGFFHDTLYYPQKRVDIAPFYNWLKANPGDIQKMSREQVWKLWRELGVKWDSN